MFSINKKKAATKNDNTDIGFKGFLAHVTPKRGYHFFSDYFRIDDCYATIMTVFHNKGADRNLHPMWGINLIPRNLERGVSTHTFFGFHVMPHRWVDKYRSKADEHNRNEQNEAFSSNHKHQQIMSKFDQDDNDMINLDLAANDTYMAVDFKILIKAQSLPQLDRTVHSINRYYGRWFDSVYLHAYDGRQYNDLQSIFQPADLQVGKNYMFTSAEYAGCYNLVSHGINDDWGDYCGESEGDINATPVNFDIDNFHSHVIIAANQKATTRSHTKFPPHTNGAGMWAQKLAQNAMTNNHRVVHIVLNNDKVDQIGLKMPNITTRIPMNKGAINPFEMFGRYKDSLKIFPAHIMKLRLMVEQIIPQLNEKDLGKPFDDVIKEFYTYYHHMWSSKPKHAFKKHLLRIVGISHKEYPRLRDFDVYLASALKIAKHKHDMQKVNSLELLQSAFSARMNDENGALFGNYTSPIVDNAHRQVQTIYDFSDLMELGSSIVMAQFINALTYAVSDLHDGDLVIIHGTENIIGDAKNRYSVKKYVYHLFQRLQRRGIRIAYLYDSVQDMLGDIKFNHFSNADWVLTGYMDRDDVQNYQNAMKQSLPPDLVNRITSSRSPLLYYLRRDVTNVVFLADPILTIPKKFMKAWHIN